MGNSYNHSNRHTQLIIQLDFPFYTSGQTLRGIIYLNTTEVLTASALYLSIEGIVYKTQVSRDLCGTKVAPSIDAVITDSMSFITTNSF
jgi:hypothetical protein